MAANVLYVIGGVISTAALFVGNVKPSLNGAVLMILGAAMLARW